MIFKIAGQAEKEKVVNLKLVDDGDGEISLIAVDGDDPKYEWKLLTFSSDSGTVYRRKDVNSKLGFCIDDFGRIVIE